MSFMLFFVERLAGQYLLTGRGEGIFFTSVPHLDRIGAPLQPHFWGGGKVTDHSPPSRTVFHKLLCWLTSFGFEK